MGFREDEVDSYPGVYCLRTSHADWDESLLWNTYTMLTDLEAVFRSLKFEFGLRPIHHQSTRPEAKQQEMYSVLGVKSCPGQTVKTII